MVFTNSAIVSTRLYIPYVVRTSMYLLLLSLSKERVREKERVKNKKTAKSKKKLRVDMLLLGGTRGHRMARHD